MVKLNLIIIIILILNTEELFCQFDGTFDFTGAGGNGVTVTQTQDGVLLTVSDNAGDVELTDGGSFAGTTGNIAYSNSTAVTMTLSFNNTVNIRSIRCFNGYGENNDATWVFTPNSGSAVNSLVDSDGGTNVQVEFTGITSINITIQSDVGYGSSQYPFGIDDVFMDSTLPVELTSFLSLVTLNSVKLKWETATEVNNYGFDVERSAFSGQQSDKEVIWEKIGFVEGHGNSNSPKRYVFEDNTFVAGQVYKYRLKQIDFDGAYEYSDELTVETTVPERAELAQNYPNPFNPSTTIKFSMPEADFAKLTVYNSIGQEVTVLINENLEPGFYTYLFDGSDLASGAYIYKLETAGRIITKKMLLIK